MCERSVRLFRQLMNQVRHLSAAGYLLQHQQCDHLSDLTSLSYFQPTSVVVLTSQHRHQESQISAVELGRRVLKLAEHGYLNLDQLNQYLINLDLRRAKLSHEYQQKLLLRYGQLRAQHRCSCDAHQDRQVWRYRFFRL